ncbi:zinc finger matrin-type protein 1 [Nothobranchius furzeri]
MEEFDVCTLRDAESDVQTDVTAPFNVASVIDAANVINSKTGSTRVKEKSDEELLKGLLTDAYCYVCSSVLMFESHRLSHYEGKKHNQKVRMYLDTVRGEKTRTFQTMSSSKNRFCELCNMVFNSDVVAKSHYEGKVHAKHLRKQSLHLSAKDTGVCASLCLTQNPEKSEEKSAQESDDRLQMHTTAASASTSAEFDLKDPNKYCCLCTVSFTDPQTALQHYNGRKHQKKQARQELLKELGDENQLDDSLVCHRCDVKLNSVEMYQAHMHGNKHQIKGKKINDLFKSQPKAYSTFADELADYIQAQKSRGVTPKISQTLPQEGTEEECDQEVLTEFNDFKSSESVRGFTQNHQRARQLTPGMRHPSYPGPPWPARGWDCHYPPPLPVHGVPLFPSQPTGHRRPRTPSSSCTSLSYSSDSSHTSRSEDSEHRLRDARRKRKSRRDRGGKDGDEESDMEERRKHRRRKRRRRERDHDSGEVRRDPCEESVEEGRRKKIKSHNKLRPEKQQENFESGGKTQTEDVMENRNETRLQAETNTDQRERRHRAAKTKYGKEKRKGKEKVDLRTEEEKLWDVSILGC